MSITENDEFQGYLVLQIKFFRYSAIFFSPTFSNTRSVGFSKSWFCFSDKMLNRSDMIFWISRSGTISSDKFLIWLWWYWARILKIYKKNYSNFSNRIYGILILCLIEVHILKKECQWKTVVTLEILLPFKTYLQYPWIGQKNKIKIQAQEIEIEIIRPNVVKY